MKQSFLVKPFLQDFLHGSIFLHTILCENLYFARVLALTVRWATVQGIMETDTIDVITLHSQSV